MNMSFLWYESDRNSLCYTQKTQKFYPTCAYCNLVCTLADHRKPDGGTATNLCKGIKILLYNSYHEVYKGAQKITIHLSSMLPYFTFLHYH